MKKLLISALLISCCGRDSKKVEYPSDEIFFDESVGFPSDESSSAFLGLACLEGMILTATNKTTIFREGMFCLVTEFEAFTGFSEMRLRRQTFSLIKLIEREGKLIEYLVPSIIVDFNLDGTKTETKNNIEYDEETGLWLIVD